MEYGYLMINLFTISVKRTDFHLEDYFHMKTYWHLYFQVETDVFTRHLTTWYQAVQGEYQI